MEKDSNYKVLEVEIHNMKEDIKEIKLDNKETNKHFAEVITALKENAIVQTEIQKNQNEIQKYQNEKTDHQLNQLNDDIGELRVEITTNMKNQTKWYQEYLSKYTGKVLSILIIIIAALMGLKFANIDITKLLSII